MWQAQNVTPPTPTPLPPGRDVLPIVKLCTTRVLAGQPMNQNPLQGHLWSYSMEALNKESEFATLHVMFQCPWITLHEFLSGDENADQLRLDQEIEEHGHGIWQKYSKSDYRITPHAVWPKPGKEKN